MWGGLPLAILSLGCVMSAKGISQESYCGCWNNSTMVVTKYIGSKLGKGTGKN